MKRFHVQFLALACSTPEALEMWRDLGLKDWVLDSVIRQDQQATPDGPTDEGGRYLVDLALSLDAMGTPKGMPISRYMTLINIGDGRAHVSHIGMRATAEEAEEYRRYFAARGIHVRREYVTLAHANIPGRRFHDIFFATAPILGVDIEISVEIKP